MNQSGSDEAVRRRAELQLIASDIRWSWGIARDAAARVVSSPIPLLCLVNDLSLIIYESQQYLVRREPTLAQTLVLQFANLVEQSRHRTKLFDDTRLGMEGVTDYFSEGLIAAHREKFIGSVRLPLASQWKTDLGLFTYRGRQIATTHVIHFNLGTPPDMLSTYGNGVLPRGMGEDIGRYLAALATAFESQLPRMDWEARSFLAQIDPGQLGQRDVRSRAYYGSHFGGRLPLGVLGALDAFRCALDTINVLLAADTSPEAAATLCKIRFVTLYHVLKGLQQVLSGHSQALDGPAEQRLQDIEQHPTSVILETTSSRLFRNTLIHYGLDKRCPTSALDLGQPLAGLPDFYYPDVGFSNLATLLQEHTERVAKSLDEWAA